eukprot:TRINITY_DN23620_c0_g1_i1.p1 TRINITY_DN23620_c0_g1~~TRINITY_DN23620_c0_g1_i1.p1  ORF type:complete len:271 (-),score=50.88 TRINITY_DN23620_c0_g1_i1:1264-2076(-)
MWYLVLSLVYIIICLFFFFLMIRRPPRSTHCISSAASDVYKRQVSTRSTWADNLRQYYYKKPMSIEKKQMKYAITTCGHVVHRQCHQAQMANIQLPENYRSDDINLMQLETLCPLCKQCSNIFVVVADPYIEQSNPILLLQKLNFVDISEIKQLLLLPKKQGELGIIFKQQVKPEKLVSQICEFMTILALAAAIEEQQLQDNGSLVLLQELLKSCTVFLLDNCFIMGLSKFYTSKNINLFRNLYLSFKIQRTMSFSIEEQEQLSQQQYCS